jgi:hypothetical protein
MWRVSVEVRCRTPNRRTQREDAPVKLQKPNRHTREDALVRRLPVGDTTADIV